MRRYWIKQQQRGEPLRVSGAPAGCGSSASGELGSGAHPPRGPGRAGAAGAAAPRRVAWGRPGGAPAGGALRSALGSPPRSSSPLSPLGLAAGSQRVPPPPARVPIPDGRSGTDAAVLVRDVGSGCLRPGPSSRRHRGPRSEGDEGLCWAPLYLRNQREQRLLHGASFDLES